MLAKISSKNQLTLPKKVIEALQLGKEKYVDLEITKGVIVMKPVEVTIEETISEKQLEKFEEWALDHTHDISFTDAASSTQFLKKRLKKK
ncbi:MAG: AbrB/MazE/SpoVT family DNA-binding domain-containing protein [Deltaproteobacteria bacterium]|nr:AbrB/MazE/SpoVT family DNA-binding domain-containing protein [Deltaproteobacteria bacterium]